MRCEAAALDAQSHLGALHLRPVKKSADQLDQEPLHRLEGWTVHIRKVVEQFAKFIATRLWIADLYSDEKREVKATLQLTSTSCLHESPLMRM